MKDLIFQLAANAAKAIAAFLAPFVLIVAAWVAEKIGLPVEISLDDADTYISAGIMAVFTAVWVYFQKNKPLDNKQIGD